MTGPRYSQAGMQALKHGEAVTLTPGGVRGMVPREGEAAYRSGDRIVPARQARNLLAAVESVSPRHDCPGLQFCWTHPRWHVISVFGLFDVYGPYESGAVAGSFLSLSDAVRYATERARAEQLAAIQDGGAGR